MIPERREILQIDVHTLTSHTKVDLAEDLQIYPEDIKGAYIEQSAKYAYWATVALQAKFLYDRKKQEVNRQDEYLKKTLYGRLDAEVRAMLEMDGEKITEAKVGNAINIHENYLAEQDKLYKLQDELLALQEQYQKLEIAKEAMNQRKDMLISLGAQLRLESSNTD